MLFFLKPAMLKTIQNHLYKAKASGHVLDIYKTAEQIRLEHINDNVAREDIIERLVFFAGTMAIEFNPKSADSEYYSSFLPNGADLPLANEGAA